MIPPAWDLDAPVHTPPVPTGFRAGPVLLLAVGLAGLGLGGLTGSALAPPAAPRFPATATLNVRDLYIDTSARTADAVVVLRLQVDNPEAGSVRVDALVLDGVTGTSNVLPVKLRVAAHSSAVADLAVHPDCSEGREPIGMRAWLKLTGSSGSGSQTVRIAPARALSRSGVCSALDSELPNDWRRPLLANTTRQTGGDLEITVNDLSAAQLVGNVVDDQLLPTVFVGDQLITTTAELRPGEATRLRLQGPPPCIQFSPGIPIPSTLRLLAEGEQGIQQRLVVVGPALPQWLRLNCG